MRRLGCLKVASLKKLEKEQEILSLINNEDTFEKGFYLLVDEFKERLYWHIRRMVHYHDDTDDVLQNVFIKVFKNIKGFEGNSKLYTWLYRIATNETITYINKNKKHQSSESDAINNLSNTLKADQYFDGDEAILILKSAIDLLPNKQQIIFNMRYYDEMSYKDISEALGTSVGALKASYHHATKKIEQYLKEHADHV